MGEARDVIEALIANVERVIVGKRRVIEEAVICLLSKGHLLIEDVPGVGKTMLARSLATSLGASFRRIQFTPDMLPSDVTGVSVYSQATEEFEFRPGPVMAEIVLADEINRATPKTQSALLEAMQERQVTVDGVSYPLPEVFLVMATENPVEYEGTFRLPEAQLDRFLMKIRIGYPEKADELDMLEQQQLRHPIDELQPVTTAEAMLEAQEAIKRVHVAPALRDYIVDLVRMTRDHSDIYLGSSPRGSLGLYRAAQARATLEGRDYVLPADIKTLATPVLGHRMILAPGAQLRDYDEKLILDELVRRIAVPGGAFKSDAGG